jgi:hypothetical protein
MGLSGCAKFFMSDVKKLAAIKGAVLLKTKKPLHK